MAVSDHIILTHFGGNQESLGTAFHSQIIYIERIQLYSVLHERIDMIIYYIHNYEIISEHVRHFQLCAIQQRK